MNKQWCDHYNRQYRTRETCWKLHGKPANWKPQSQRDKPIRDGSRSAYATAAAAPTVKIEPSQPSVQLSTDQVEFLQRFLNQNEVSSTIASSTQPATASLAHKGNLSLSLVECISKRCLDRGHRCLRSYDRVPQYFVIL